ncbi:MAG TPA: hypothetical protein VMC43_03325 [Candidatus Paceibacterota bacterium]|nr:hypothetical protein [Candidatus Paceibacterota bacterium]
MTTDKEQIRLAFRGLSDEEDEDSVLETGGDEFEPEEGAENLEEFDEEGLGEE